MPRQLRDARRRDLGELGDRSRENLLQLQVTLFDEVLGFGIDRHEHVHVLHLAPLLQVPNRIPARIVIRPGVADDIAARLHPHRELVGEAVQRVLGHVEVTQALVGERDVHRHARDRRRICPRIGRRHQRRDVGDELPSDFRRADVVEDVARDRKPEAAVGLDDVPLDVAEIQLRNHAGDCSTTRGRRDPDGKRLVSRWGVRGLPAARARRTR